jgi:hypothetical protein
MAWLAPILSVLAFGGMALWFGWSERAEERRILARAEEVLAREGATLEVPGRDEGAGLVVAMEGEAFRVPSAAESGVVAARHGPPGRSVA